MFRKSVVLAFFVMFTLVVGAAGAVSAQEYSTYAQETPANLAPPDTSVLLFELHATGVQIYTCGPDQNDATKYVWTFKAPEADLLNSRGELAGTHFAGPTWQGLDGSAVVGAVLERADAPDASSIPWLLLEAKEHQGSGAFSTITYVQRLDTVGGVAPAEGCDDAHEGEEVRVPYKATYAFYYPVAPVATPAP